MISPCKDCERRNYLCHSKCTDYLDYKNKLHIINQIKSNENDYIMYKIRSINRMKKARKK